jgi:hypothetical protein
MTSASTQHPATSMDWYVATSAGDKIGPLSLDDLADLAAQKTIDRHSLAWKKGMERWQMISDIPDLKNIFQERITPFKNNADTLHRSSFKDFLEFKIMLTYSLIKVLYVFGAIWITGVSVLDQGRIIGRHSELSSGFELNIFLLILIGGNIAWRVLCEMLIIGFRISQSLSNIENSVQQPHSSTVTDLKKG